MGYTVVVDDDDRAHAPDKPWTANIYNATGQQVGVGIGATVADALRDVAANEHEWEED